MLARINSAASGIVEYLELGRKKGREFDRDLIDDRLPLAGDIEFLDAVIDGIETQQEGDSRYLHITLGFAEQFTAAEECEPGQINARVLHEVVDAYREAVMAAYDPSEYMFYAEAHIPKVTHELNARSGDYESRLPHVHIVIPMRNLESDRFMNPFGYLMDMGVPDAIQEQINQRFGLKSPKQSKRDPAAPEHPLGRHEASFEGQSPKQIRAYLSSLVADRHVDTFEQLVEAASVIGVTTVRQGKDGSYINVKPDWADKGINIKGLSREGFAAEAEALRAPAPASDYDQVVEQWRARGAFEARYVASPRLKKAFKAMSPAEQDEFLSDRRAETRGRLAVYDEPIERQLVSAAAEAINRAMAKVEEQGVPIPRPAGFAARIKSLIKELKNGRPERTFGADGNADRAKPSDGADFREDLGRDGRAIRGRLGQDSGKAPRAAGGQLGADQGPSRDLTDAELKGETDPDVVLAVAHERFGIDLAEYLVAKGKDGKPRIIHAGRQYNLGDFFTKHLQQPWAEARPILAECHARTLAKRNPNHDVTDPRADSQGDRSSQGLLRRAAAAIARGQQIAADPAQVARYFQRRNLGAALEATLRGLREDRSQDQNPLTPRERLERSAAAIARGAQAAKDPATIRAALDRRNLGQALATTLRRLTIDRPQDRKSQTVIEAIAASAHRIPLAPDRLKADTNPAIVLTAAQRLYGIDPAAYSIGTGSDGSPRIIHQDKQYNLGDFFTKHLKRPWKEAEGVLKDCYHASISDALPPPDKALWRQFSQWRSRQFEEVAARRAGDSEGFRTRVLQSREDYKRKKQDAQSLPGRMRAAAVARARADQFIAQQTIAAERARASSEARVPRRNAHYREYLVELASAGDTAALAELRRMAPHEKDVDLKISGGRSQPVFPLPTYTVDARGGVTYRSDGGAIVRDAAQGVTVLAPKTKAYDAAIRVAIARYGRTLTLNGDPQFVAAMTDAARRTGLELTLRDSSRPQAMPVVLHARGRASPNRER